MSMSKSGPPAKGTSSPMSQSPNRPQDANPSDDMNKNPPKHRFLTPAEWAIMARGVGAVRDAEQHKPIHPSYYWWPPRGMVPGLYQNVVLERTKSYYHFHATSIFRWTLMILQLFIGATLTALGPQEFRRGVPITVLGATNTIIAGLLALLHNSGLPDRYRHNMGEFERIEDHIRGLLDTGLAPTDKTIDQILAECFQMFQDAKATIEANLPTTYKPSQRPTSGQQSDVIWSSKSQPTTENKKDQTPVQGQGQM